MKYKNEKSEKSEGTKYQASKGEYRSKGKKPQRGGKRC
jgi:hypothetical protein